MKKVIEQSLYFKDKFLQYQEKQLGNFESFLQKQNEKKNKITQKLIDLQQKLAKAKPHKQERFQEKIASLEAELQQLQKKEQIAKDFHLVYDGLSQQLLMCQNQNIQQMSQKEKDDNYQIVCQIKRQAYNVRKQVFKQKHIYPLTKMMEQCDQLISVYLKAGVCLNVIQPDILNLGNNDQEQGRQDKWEIKQQQKYQQKNQKMNQQQDDGYQNIPFKVYKDQQKQQDQPQHQQKIFLQQQQVPNKSEILDLQSQFVKVSINQQDIKKDQKEEKTESSDDKNLCQICFEHPKAYVAVPCGHFIYCSTCKDLIQKQCLMCRAEVSQILKIFQ